MKNKKINYVLLTFLLVIICTFLSSDLLAQCPMCKMSAESDLKNGGTAAKGLNTGILYMLAAPYLIVATLAVVWWKNRNKNADKENSILDELESFSAN